MAVEDFPKFPEFFAGMEIAQVSLPNAVSLVPMESDCLLQLLLSLLQQTASLTAATAQVKKVLCNQLQIISKTCCKVPGCCSL